MPVNISLVTLSYNQLDYLREAVESVLAQNYPQLEYIVVDPGSKDGSRELLGRYAGGISKLIFESDSGPAEGLNKGFSMASGEIIGFLNSDDRLLPNALHVVSAFFEKNPDTELLFGNGFIIDGAGNRTRYVRARKFTVRRYFHGGSRFLQQSTFFRKSIFDRVGGFNIANRTCWDGELFISMVLSGAKVKYINENLAEFRIHPASISGSDQSKKLYVDDCRRIFRNLMGRDWNAGDELRRLIYRLEGIVDRLLNMVLLATKRG